MNADKIATIGLAIISLATITVFVTNPSSADVIRAFGQAFSENVATAMGRR